jgi:hypothetical protein
VHPVTRPPSAVEIARTGWGTALLIAPGRVWARLGVPAPGPAMLAVTRVLGARHLAQAALRPVGRPHGTIAVGVDALHAVSDVAFAAASPRHRPVVLVDAAVALGLALAGLGTRGTRRPSADRNRRLR